MSLSTDLKQQGVVGDYTTLDQFMDYKYLPTFDGVICAYPAFQWRLLSNSLTSLQQLDRQTLKNEMLSDDRWVCIQRRKSLRKKVKKEGRIADYNRSISPVSFG